LLAIVGLYFDFLNIRIQYNLLKKNLINISVEKLMTFIEGMVILMSHFIVVLLFLHLEEWSFCSTTVFSPEEN
jgi:hypothetical protein